MKQKIVLTIMAMLAFSANIIAQNNLPDTKKETSSSKNGKTVQNNDSIFKAHLVNDEYQVWMLP